ncbi:MAG: hypothetical protein WDN67_01565 [Candidatus Moraniibacteriota bacterium]
MAKQEEQDKRARLEEIRHKNLGALSDEEVLALLSERRELEEWQKENDIEALRTQKEAKRQELQADLENINARIDPSRPDDELLALIGERKELEKELSLLEADLHRADHPKSPEPPKARVPAAEKPAPSKAKKKGVKLAVKGEEETPPSVIAEPASVPRAEPKVPKKPLFTESSFGDEGLQQSSEIIDENLERYISQLDLHEDSLGTFLQSLPAHIRENRTFMLKVAAIDPAYAMHFAADKLRRDESFNISIASMKNERNTGNALAEMLPDMRTGKVVLAAVAQDFRNVRFVVPSMSEYDEILAVAKKAALEQLPPLKDAADITKLVPPVLKKDAQFMKDLEAKTGS